MPYRDDSVTAYTRTRGASLLWNLTVELGNWLAEYMTE